MSVRHSGLSAMETVIHVGVMNVNGSTRLHDYYYENIRLRGNTRHCGMTVGHWICALLNNHLYLERLKERPIKYDLFRGSNRSPREPGPFHSQHDSFTSPFWHHLLCSGTLNTQKYRLASQGKEGGEGWRQEEDVLANGQSQVSERSRTERTTRWLKPTTCFS